MPQSSPTTRGSGAVQATLRTVVGILLAGLIVTGGIATSDSFAADASGVPPQQDLLYPDGGGSNSSDIPTNDRPGVPSWEGSGALPFSPIEDPGAALEADERPVTNIPGATLLPRSLDDSGKGVTADIRSTLSPDDELVSRRTRYSRHYVYGSQILAIVTAQPMHYRDPETGTYQPISREILASSEPGVAFVNLTNSLRVRFPDGSLTDGVRVRMDTQGQDFLRLLDLPRLEQRDGTDALVEDRPVTLNEPSISGTASEQIRYAATTGDLELVYTMRPGGLKQDWVLSSLPNFVSTANGGTFHASEVVDLADGFRMEVDGETIAGKTVTTTDAVRILDPSGTLVAVIPSPLVRDASGTLATSAALRLQPITAERIRVSVAVDVAWLADAARVYPVTLDPSISPITSLDTYIAEDSPTTNFLGTDFMNVRASSSAAVRARSLIKFQDITPNNIPATITDANLHAFCFDLIAQGDVPDGASGTRPAAMNVFEIGDDWDGFEVTWDNFTGLSSSSGAREVAAAVISQGEQMWSSTDLTLLVEAWRSDAARRNRGVALSYEQNTSHDSFARFRSLDDSLQTAPYLSIIYESTGIDLATDENSTASFSPQSVRAGEDIYVTIPIINNGTRASGSFTVDLYISDNEEITSTDVRIGEARVSSINAGDSQTIYVTGRVTNVLPSRTYYVGWRIDSDFEIPETDENNNTGRIAGLRLVGGAVTSCAYNPTGTGLLPLLAMLALTAILALGLRRRW